MIVPLTPEEKSQCLQAGNMRWQLGRASQLVNKRIDGTKRDDLEIEYLGIKGECAVSKALDLSWSPFHLGTDGGADMWSGKHSIDVKTAFKNANYLLFRNIKSFKADIAILCKELDDLIEIVGWVARAEFIAEHKMIDLGYGQVAALHKDNLKEIGLLWKMLTQKKLNAVMEGLQSY